MSIKSVMSSNHLILCHLLFSCPQSFPASGFFPMSWLFTSGAQSIGASASASVLPMSIQGWFPLGLTGLISLQSKGLSRVFSSTTEKASILWCSVFFMVQLSHPYVTTGKTIALTIWTFVGRMMSLLIYLKLINLVDTQGEGVIQGHKYQEVEIMGAIWGFPQQLKFIIFFFLC